MIHKPCNTAEQTFRVGYKSEVQLHKGKIIVLACLDPLSINNRFESQIQCAKYTPICRAWQNAWHV